MKNSYSSHAIRGIFALLVCVLSLFSVSAQNAPIDFESGGNGAAWTWTVFENATNPPLGIVANPDPSGANTSPMVAEFTALDGGMPWAGCESMHGADIGTFTLDASTSQVSIMVWKSVISDVGIKFVDAGAASLGEIKVANTVTNAWEELTFDFYSNEGIAFDQIVIFPDFQDRTSDNTCYFDNISFSPNPQDLVVTTEVCDPASEVRMTGPWWGWDPAGGPIAADNGDGTWTFTLSPAPTENMEYLLVVDGVQENLIAEMQNGGDCAPITDFAAYANRQWLTTDGYAVNNTYGQCAPCNAPADLIIIAEVCDPASEVRMTGPWWGWDPAAGPIAVDNGDGTWTFTLAPAPTENMEYLLVVDGVQENLIVEMQNGGDCAPVTDFANYANRLWLTSDPYTIYPTYGQCAPCGGFTDLIITTEVCDPASEVRMTGPWWGWDPAAGPIAADNGDGTWTFTLAPAPTEDMEYLLVVDGVQENLIAEMQNGGDCAPLTDFATYANRQWLTSDSFFIDNTYGQCGVCNPPGDLIIITEVCDPATEVRMTGPWWGWDPAGGPVAADNGDGTWTFTLAPAPTENMEYLLVVDGVQENLVLEMQNGGDCAPLTDFASYANRQWLTTDPYTINNTYGQCTVCNPADLVIVTTVCDGASEVRMTGPWWGWDPAGGPIAADNGDGTWTFTLSPAPTENMEYLLVVDGVQENLIAEMQNGGTCAPITDFATYANREWQTSDPLSFSNTYGYCGSCPLPDLVIITEVCDGASEVRLTGPWWGWDPAAGPIAADNGDGTWTFTLSPAPTENMEYLLVADGVQENLVTEMQNGGTCAPITDFATYANRQWVTSDPYTISNTYAICGDCPAVVDCPADFNDDLVVNTVDLLIFLGYFGQPCN
jgi:hypothetical protein